MHRGLAAPVLESISGLMQLSRPVSANRVGGDFIARTATCFQYAPGNGSDGLFASTDNNAAATDWIAFLVSHALSGTLTVP